MSLLSPSRLFGGRGYAPADTADLITVQVESLGREHSGKTGCGAMTFRTAQDGPLPSGLYLSSPNPRELVKLMNESIATFRGLQRGGLISTIDAELVQYHLLEGDRVRAQLKLRESIGQLLTYTDEDSARRMQEQFDRHHENLASADVIQVFVSCPTDDKPESIDRLKNDLMLLMPNLLKILNCRRSDQKAAVALVVSKPDPAFATAEEARTALTDERLLRMLHRLVLLLEGSDRVALAAIFVTSAFGYGKARRLDVRANGTAGAPARGSACSARASPSGFSRRANSRSRTTSRPWCGGR